MPRKFTASPSHWKRIFPRFIWQGIDLAIGMCKHLQCADQAGGGKEQAGAAPRVMLPVMNTLCFAALLSAAGVACALAQPIAAQTAPASQTQTSSAKKTWFIRLIPPRPNFDRA
jgi:hypothetical protein